MVAAVIFSEHHSSGRARLYATINQERYHRVPSSELRSVHFYKNISSVALFAPSNADAQLILFARTQSESDTFPDYFGSFFQLTNAHRDEEQIFDLPTNLDDKAASMLLVASQRGPEFRFSFRDAFLSGWNQTVDAKLGSQASREGDPILTWEMYPQGISGLDPNTVYLKIFQKLRINLSWWPDYDAAIKYHLFLYLDDGGHLQGYVQRYADWVSGGAKTSRIQDQLWPKVISGADDVNAALAKGFAPLSGISFKDLYYLPGRQIQAATTGLFGGSTNEDVTIVLEY